MLSRIGLWALCGALVALFWASTFYFLGPAFGRYPSQFAILGYLSHSLLVSLSVPLVLLGRHWAINWYSTVAINAATYAIIGSLVELTRAAFRTGHLRLGH
jgi:hypothetical protein